MRTQTISIGVPAKPSRNKANAWLPFTPPPASFGWLPSFGRRGVPVVEGGELPARTAVSKVAAWLIVPPSGKTQRGNIAFDQVRLSDRQGTGSLFQMYGSTSAVAGDVAVFDSNLNLEDAGGPPAVWVSAPSHHNSTGFPGQQAYDGSGNFYFCYASNSWAMIGAAGYSNSF